MRWMVWGDLRRADGREQCRRVFVRGDKREVVGLSSFVLDVCALLVMAADVCARGI